VLGDPINFYDPNGLSKRSSNTSNNSWNNHQVGMGGRGYTPQQIRDAYWRMKHAQLLRNEVRELHEALKELPDYGYEVMQNELQSVTCIGPSCSITVQDCSCGFGGAFQSVGASFGNDFSADIQQCKPGSSLNEMSLRPMAQDDPNCTCTTRVISF
jgi:Tfp pilus assembly protein PilV